MLSFIGEHLGAPENARGMPDRGHRNKTLLTPHPPPSHPAATAEVGQLLDLGLALGHERFELVNLVGREEVGMVAAHAWAECGGSRRRDPDNNNRSSTTIPQQVPRRASATRSRPRPPVTRDNVRVPNGRQELHTEVEWLRERVDNLSRELVLARRDSGRLAKQLKQEEGLGREQRRKADDAVREAKALREELDRLKEDRTAGGAASRAALSDAHSRSVRMAERRRRQQAESLMQAYKGLYEDQLQTQHASSESYRSLTRGYSRLSADNKALRRETAAVAAVAAAASDAAGNAAAIIASSADMQTSSATSSSRHATAVSSRDETARSGKKERRDKTRGSSGGGGAGAVEPPESSPAAAAAATAAVRSAGTTAVRVSDDDSCGDVTVHAYAVTAAESAAAVATAAVAVAAAAGALAEAATTASSTDDEDPAALLSPSSMNKEEEEGAAAMEECAKRDLRKGRGVVVGSSSSSRDRTSSSYGPTETDCPSTVETLACSPYSDNAEGPYSTTTTTGELEATAKLGDAAVDSTGGTTFADGRAPPADCSLAPREGATSWSGALVDGDDGGSRRSCNADGGSAKGYAFPQTAGEEDRTFPTGDSVSSAASPRKKQDAQNSRDREVGKSDERCFIVEGNSKSDERCPDREGGAEVALPKKAAPPAEPAPRWRGRSGGPGRLLASSVSRAEAVDVDAPKRSSSPTPPRRGRWGECVSGGAWGGGDGGARGHECSRIEPSSRSRPHSI